MHGPARLASRRGRMHATWRLPSAMLPPGLDAHLDSLTHMNLMCHALRRELMGLTQVTTPVTRLLTYPQVPVHRAPWKPLGGWRRRTPRCVRA